MRPHPLHTLHAPHAARYTRCTLRPPCALPPPPFPAPHQLHPSTLAPRTRDSPPALAARRRRLRRSTIVSTPHPPDTTLLVRLLGSSQPSPASRRRTLEPAACSSDPLPLPARCRPPRFCTPIRQPGLGLSLTLHELAASSGEAKPNPPRVHPASK